MKSFRLSSDVTKFGKGIHCSVYLYGHHTGEKVLLVSMETDVEGSDDDAQGQSKHTVLWEKCIHQSIYVDLSENESLNLSDLERSLLLRGSQDESAASVPSVHLTGRSSSHCCFKIPFYYMITLV